MSEIVAAFVEFLAKSACEPDVGTLEVEMRLLDTTPAYFYETYERLARSGKVIKSSVEYSDVVSSNASEMRCKRRTDRCGRCHASLGSLRKTCVGRGPRDIATDRGRLRFSVQRETPIRDEVVGNTVRHKRRMSLRLIHAESWRIDFTRVNVGDAEFHEIEIELDNDALQRCTDAEHVGHTAMQAIMILGALEVTLDSKHISL